MCLYAGVLFPGVLRPGTNARWRTPIREEGASLDWAPPKSTWDVESCTLDGDEAALLASPRGPYL